MQMNFDLNRIWDQIYEAGNRPVEQRSELLDSLLAHLEIEAHVHPSADVYYAIGYLCYVHPDKSERMQAKLLASLSKSIELKPTFASPKLQLGHYYYDLADYRTAISYFREAARADWSEYYALWLQEMILCCLNFSDGLPSALPKLEAFVSKCLKANPDDVFAHNLFKCLLRVVPECSDAGAAARTTALLEKLARGTDLERVFHDDLEKLVGLANDNGAR